MNKWSVAALLVLCTCCGIGGLMSWRTLSISSEISRDASSWAERELGGYFSSWDAARLRTLAAPQLQDQMNLHEMQQISRSFEKDLGRLKGQTRAKAEGFEAKGGKIYAAIVVSGDFERRPGVFHVKLTRAEGSQWAIADLRLDPPASR